MSFYDDMGGEPALRAVLRTLYDRLFDDLMVGFLFAGKDKERLIEHQLWFTARFLGGPSRYEGKSIPDAHAALPLLPGHFDRRHHLLAEALDSLKPKKWGRIDAPPPFHLRLVVQPSKILLFILYASIV